RRPGWWSSTWGRSAQRWPPSRNRSWLTPVAPSGAPASGADTPYQVWPPSSVAAMEVQMLGWGGPHWPGVPAWPSTQPAVVDTKVTEETAKPGSAVVGFGEAESGPVVTEGDAWTGLRQLPSTGPVHLEAC